MSAPRDTTSPLCLPLPKPPPTTTLSLHPALSASEGLRRSSWYLPILLQKHVRTLTYSQGPPIPLYEPLESGVNDNIFISKSYDATSHFETTTDDVKDIYRRAEGHDLVVEGLREGTNLVGED